MSATLVFSLFIAFFLAQQLTEWALSGLNLKSLKRNPNIPEPFKGIINEEDHHKSLRYTRDKLIFGFVTSAVSVIVTLALILSGLFEKTDAFVGTIIPAGSLSHSVVYCLMIALGLLLFSIPASLYSHFVIEKKYGFNKLTPTLFVVDLVKGLLIGGALLTPLLYGIFWIYSAAGPFWWPYAFIAVFAFELFIAAVFPAFLAPLFNKFTPLADGSLKNAVLALAKKINFKLSGVYTIDGSKRSKHSNAYFAGMGRFRRIVLFDTLVDQMTEKEIIAVLAHEMGHNKKKHVQKHLIVSFVTMGLGFWALGQLIAWPAFYDAFRAGSPAPHKALILFALFSGTITFWMTPIMNGLSRKHEYEADAFSVSTTGDKPSMMSSLIKLTKENLSQLMPHRLYSFWHYSHPTTLERIEAIKNLPS